MHIFSHKVPPGILQVIISNGMLFCNSFGQDGNHISGYCLEMLELFRLRWPKSRESYRRIASESYRCDSNR